MEIIDPTSYDRSKFSETCNFGRWGGVWSVKS